MEKSSYSLVCFSVCVISEDTKNLFIALFWQRKSFCIFRDEICNFTTRIQKVMRWFEGKRIFFNPSPSREKFLVSWANEIKSSPISKILGVTPSEWWTFIRSNNHSPPHTARKIFTFNRPYENYDSHRHTPASSSTSPNSKYQWA